MVEVEFAVVVEDDLVLQRGGNFTPLGEAHAAKDGIDIAKGFHSHAEPESHLQAGIPGAVFAESDLIVLVHCDENLGQGHIFLRVKIKN